MNKQKDKIVRVSIADAKYRLGWRLMNRDMEKVLKFLEGCEELKDG